MTDLEKLYSSWLGEMFKVMGLNTEITDRETSIERLRALVALEAKLAPDGGHGAQGEPATGMLPHETPPSGSDQEGA